jgi:hypothetical protein
MMSLPEDIENLFNDYIETKLFDIQEMHRIGEAMKKIQCEIYDIADNLEKMSDKVMRESISVTLRVWLKEIIMRLEENE